ncbi:YihY/virulence factor BrkB family protein [Aeromicrobium sp. Leaf350]|uniref:YihY/virulence factor BrkB family protein n=1 Tax=Aeromicrobium sp. Leaf350 TaxID=2876565 RepID=UPI001E61838B|nr:YihY/virulence factor BrkB family protein [Aeromicrobium sp. Leaf350]
MSASGSGWPDFVTQVPRVARHAFSNCFRNRVTGLAAEAAFFAILSLPPLVFGLAGAIGFIAERYQVAQVDVLKDRVIDLASRALTDSTVDAVITPTLDEVLRGGRFDVVSIGFLLALWSGSRALNVFIDTITIMYGLGGHRGIVKTRALSFGLYVVALVLGIVLVPLLLAGPDVVQAVTPDNVNFLTQLYWPTVLLLSVGFLCTLYHLAVPIRKSWRSGLPGAFFTIAMWIFGAYLVRWLLGFSSGGTSIYGPLAAPIAVLLLLYVLSISVLIGAAINAAYDELRHPEPSDESVPAAKASDERPITSADPSPPVGPGRPVEKPAG